MNTQDVTRASRPSNLVYSILAGILHNIVCEFNSLTSQLVLLIVCLARELESAHHQHHHHLLWTKEARVFQFM